ncbi:hypothetical protein [Cryptosporangium arvum]|uniref:Secreted protein n=1 Tax=Cryptosporangium arvum DSM 44712 TaxID=927661 RepID=A0A010ZYW0_9ACTN|nr:hypothetical protein [Cryptosporangium arvum]EXG82397.1 hypothetical protein CryarDRAFT_3577 [Cryptosporangium arvum DSM 44712]
MRKLFGATLGTLMLGGLLVGGAAPAQAAVEVKGPYTSRSACIQEQSNYARYYRITRQCWNIGPSGNNLWYFNYNPDY